MLILLKMTCFGLWFCMLLVLLLVSKKKQFDPAQEWVIYLNHPANAEKTIRHQLRSLAPEARLRIEVLDGNHSEIEELMYIIKCFQRRNHSIVAVNAHAGLNPNNI